MNKNKYFSRLLLASLCLFSSLSYASFDVIEEGDIDYYGNANIPPFRDAVGGEDPLSPQDRAFLAGVDQIRIINRWYLRALLGNPSVKLNDNTVSAISNTTGAELTFKLQDQQGHLVQLLIAWGYLWENWALEAELFISKKLDLYSNPIAPGFPDFSYITELKQYALMFNAQYIIPHWWAYYPTRLQIHFDAGFGPVYKGTNSTLTTADGLLSKSVSHDEVSLGGNLGVGARYQVTPKLLVDVAYRYFHFGSVEFRTVDNPSPAWATVEAKSDLLKSNGLFFGFTYQY